MIGFISNQWNANLQNFGTPLRLLREQLKLSREVVAERGIIPISTLRNIEAGGSFTFYSFFEVLRGYALCVTTDKEKELFSECLFALVATFLGVKEEELMSRSPRLWPVLFVKKTHESYKAYKLAQKKGVSNKREN